MREVLVTGGAGFIGANFVHYLLGSDPTVRVVTLDKLTYAGSRASLAGLPDPHRHHFVHGDICDAELLRGLMQQHAIDTVVHFAAESHVDRSIAAPGTFVQTNVVGTYTLLQAAREAWANGRSARGEPVRFHHVSTDEVFGSLEPEAPAFTETTRYDPRSPYAASKAASDHLVQAYAHTYHLPISLTQLLEQLRALPVSREADPADDRQRPVRTPATHLRRRPQRARLALRGRSLPGH